MEINNKDKTVANQQVIFVSGKIFTRISNVDGSTTSKHFLITLAIRKFPKAFAFILANFFGYYGNRLCLLFNLNANLVTQPRLRQQLIFGAPFILIEAD